MRRITIALLFAFGVIALAPEMTAPCGSVNVPTMLPVLTVVCAGIPEQIISRIAPSARRNRRAVGEKTLSFGNIFVPSSLDTLGA